MVEADTVVDIKSINDDSNDSNDSNKEKTSPHTMRWTVKHPFETITERGAMWRSLRKSKLKPIQKVKGNKRDKKASDNKKVSKHDDKKNKREKKPNDKHWFSKFFPQIPSVSDHQKKPQIGAANDALYNKDITDKKTDKKTISGSKYFADKTTISTSNSARLSGGTSAFTQPQSINAGEFTTLRVLGTGGYGVVYKVQHNHSKQVFALKVINKTFAPASDFRLSQTLAEREVITHLDHQHLLPLYAAFQDENDLYLLMPEMPAGDLSEFLQNVGLMSEGMCSFYAAELILAFEYLHGKGIIFRDLKPSNILMDSTGHIVLSDYGLCVNKMAGMSDLAGTVGYMAPEALQNKQPAPSFDVWTFGCTLYKLMTGHRPFRSARSVVCDTLKFKGKRAQNLSDITKDLLCRLLNKDPSNRLGCGEGGWDEIKRHPFFEGIEWTEISNMKPPYIPSQEVLDHYDNNPTTVLPEKEKRREKLDPQLMNKFDSWSYNTHKCQENAFIWSSYTITTEGISSVTVSPLSTRSTNKIFEKSPVNKHWHLNSRRSSRGTTPGIPPLC